MNQKHANAAVTAGLVAALMVTSVPAPAIAEALQGDQAPAQTEVSTTSGEVAKAPEATVSETDPTTTPDAEKDVEGEKDVDADKNADAEKDVAPTVTGVTQPDDLVVAEGAVALPQVVETKLSDGTTGEAAVAWKVTGELVGTDPAQLPAGSYVLQGTVEGFVGPVEMRLEVQAPTPAPVEDDATEEVEPSEEATPVKPLSNDPTGDVEGSVEVSEGVIVINGVRYTYATRYTVVQGFDQESELPNYLELQDEDDVWWTAAAEWNLDAVDLSQPGEYEATCSVNLWMGDMAGDTVEVPVTIVVAEVEHVPTEVVYNRSVGDEGDLLEYVLVNVVLANGGSKQYHVTWDKAEYAAYLENADVPGTYTVHGTIDGSSYQVTATVWVQEVRSIQAETVYTEPGVAPDLPSTVWVEREDGESFTRSVTWDAVDESLYAESGYFEVMGSVEGTDIKALAQVYVSPIVSISEVNEVTVVGTPASLPSFVTVSYEYGTTSVDVEWDVPADDDELWATAGTFDIYGSLPNTDRQAVCHVTVIDSTSYENEVDVRATIGSLSLPYYVDAVLEDGTERSLSVDWDYGSYDDEDLYHEGTFDVSGFVLGSEKLPITAHVTVVGIESVDAIEPVTTTEGVLPNLSYSVGVTYTDGERGYESIDWEMPPSETFVADDSPITINGTLYSTGQPVSVQVNVQWVQPAREVVEVSTLVGWRPELPSYVEMTMSDGTKQGMEVQWETPDPASYAVAGQSFDVQGYVRGSDYPITAHVGVYDAVSGISFDRVTGPGIEPYLPTTLDVELTNGDTLSIYDRVVWDEVDPAALVAGAEIDVAGSVLGTSVKLSAHVTVKGIAALVSGPDTIKHQYYITDGGSGITLVPNVTGILEDGTRVSVPAEWDELDDAYLTTPGVYTVKGTAAGQEISCSIDSVRLVSVEVTEPIVTVVGVEPETYGDWIDACVAHVVDANGESTRDVYPGAIEFDLSGDPCATAGEKTLTGTVGMYNSDGNTIEVPLTATLRVYDDIASYEPVDVWTTPGVKPSLPYQVSVTCSDTSVLAALARAVGLSEGESDTFDAEVTWEEIDPALYAADKNNTTFTVKGVINGMDVPVEATVSVADIANVSVPASVSTAPGVYPSLPYLVSVVSTDGKTHLKSVSWEDIAGSAYHEPGATFDVTGTVSVNAGISREVVTSVTVLAPAEVVGEEEVSGILTVKTEEGVVPILPYTVPVRLDDGSVVPMSVSWEPLSYADYTEAGKTVEVTGTIEGFAGTPAAASLARVAPTGTVTAKVEVIDGTEGDPVVSNVITSYQTLTQGDNVSDVLDLTSGFAEVRMSDGTYDYLEITWDDSTIDYNVPGTYVMHGTLETGDPAVCFVTLSATQNKIVGVEPFERTFGLPADRDTIAAGLPQWVTVSYSNGSTGLAEVTWDLSGLTGEALAKPGDIEITGTVMGSDLVAKAMLHLVEGGQAYATGVKTPAAIETVETVAPALPSEVTLEMSDGTTKTTGVTWDDVNPVDYALGKAGTSFTVSGVTLEGAFTVTQTVSVTELVTVDGITITGEGVKDGEATVWKGESLTLSAQLTPSDAYYRDVTWTSSDPSVATVTADGVVTAVGPGTATITATSAQPDGPSASIEVAVPKSFTGYKLDVTKTEYKVGEAFDPSTVSVSAVFDNGDEEALSPAVFTVSDVDTSKAGTVEVTVEVLTKPTQTLKFTISVSEDGEQGGETGGEQGGSQGGQQGGQTGGETGGQQGGNQGGNQGGQTGGQQPGDTGENPGSDAGADAGSGTDAPEVPATGDPASVAGAVGGSGILALLGAWVARRRSRRQ